MKKIMLLLSLVLIGSNLAGWLTAQDAATHPMARFLDENTIAFARIDLELLNVDVLYREFETVAGDEEELMKAAVGIKTIANKTRRALLDAGVSKLYFFSSFDDLISGPVSYAILPTEGDVQQAKTVAKEVVDHYLPQFQCTAIEGGVFIGTSTVLDRIKTNRLPIRKDAQELLSLAELGINRKRHDLTIVFSFTEDQRRVLREVPAEFGPPMQGITGAMIADGIRHVRIHGKTESLFLQAHCQGQTSFNLGEEEREGFNTDIGNRLMEVFEAIKSGKPNLFSELPGDVRKSLEHIRFTNQSNSPSFDITINRDAFRQLAKTLVPLVIEANKKTNPHMINSVRTIALAVHKYESAFTKFPEDMTDQHGNPTLSWRVALLPFMNEAELFSQFNPNEPWDSEHNKPLIAKMPAVFQTGADLTTEGKTIWTIPAGEGYFGAAQRFENLHDGASNTLMVVGTTPEAAMTWTQPGDWKPDPDNPKNGIFSETQKRTAVARGDGVVQTMTDETTDETLMKFLKYADGEVVEEIR